MINTFLFLTLPDPGVLTLTPSNMWGEGTVWWNFLSSFFGGGGWKEKKYNLCSSYIYCQLSVCFV